MAIFETDLDYTNLIQFSNGTLQLASFVQIRNALIQRMKDIYGNDIDVSAASADGQYINSIALLINNIFQSIRQSYNSLDPAVATGQYLDTLCSFNNIFRIAASGSTTSLYVYNHTNTAIDITQLLFVDKNNNLWMWDNGGFAITIQPQEYAPIEEVTCTEFGAINAPGAGCYYKKDSNSQWVETQDIDEMDWSDPGLFVDPIRSGTLYQCVNDNGLYVWQYADAAEGNVEETDEALRSRRYQMLGNNSVTILEGLKGNLLNIFGVKDVHIFNNLSSTSVPLSGSTYQPLSDLTTVLGHSIYVAIRYQENVEVLPSSIGKVIYDKLTPGIATTPIDNNTLYGQDGHLDIPRTDQFTDTISWKICTDKHPTLTINFFANTNYNFPESGSYSEIEQRIIDNIKKYTDEVAIDDYLTIPNILTVMQQADILKNGMSTFFAQSGHIGSDPDAQKEPAELAYFKYTTFTFTYTLDGNNKPMTGNATLVIS